jgi:hypothetical protein
MKCSNFKTCAEAIQRIALEYTRAHIKPYDAESSAAPQSLGSQLIFQSTGRQVATGPHKLAITSTVFRHLCTQKDPQARLEQLKLSKVDPSIWP